MMVGASHRQCACTRCTAVTVQGTSRELLSSTALGGGASAVSLRHSGVPCRDRPIYRRICTLVHTGKPTRTILFNAIYYAAASSGAAHARGWSGGFCHRSSTTTWQSQITPTSALCAVTTLPLQPPTLSFTFAHVTLLMLYSEHNIWYCSSQLLLNTLE